MLETKKDKNFEKILTETETLYEKIGSVYCPCLKVDIAFNSKGIRHIKFKKDTVARSRDDQIIRLKHLYLAQKLIEKSHTLQEYRECKTFERIKKNNKHSVELKGTRYYGFIAILRDKQGVQKRLRVIVKQVSGGDAYFWSIVPFWKNNKDAKRVMHGGDPETD